MSVVAANDFTSTKESRKALLDKLNRTEKLLFKMFVLSVQGKE